jgi:hypothetical protein
MCLANVIAGERHAYAIMLLAAMFAMGASVSYVWYDINCRFKASLLAWAHKSDANTLAMVNLILAYPIPPMHVNMHQCVPLLVLRKAASNAACSLSGGPGVCWHSRLPAICQQVAHGISTRLRQWLHVRVCCLLMLHHC